MEMELCYSTTFYGPEKPGGITLREGLQILHEAGIRKVELSRKRDISPETVEHIQDLGMKVWSIHGTFGCLSDDPQLFRQSLDHEIARMRASAPFAPCPYVLHYLDRFNDPAKGQRFRQAIGELAAANADIGLILTIETVPHKPQNERYPFSSEVASFVRSWNSPKIQMTVDINHSNLNEDLFQVIRNCRGLIANIHVSDNHGFCEEHLLPGEGIIPLKATMLELRRNGYTGPCNLELHLPDVITVDFIRRINDQVRSILA